MFRLTSCQWTERTLNLTQRHEGLMMKPHGTMLLISALSQLLLLLLGFGLCV